MNKGLEQVGMDVVCSEKTPSSLPYNRPSVLGKELEYVSDAIRRGHASGNGAYTQRCERLLEEILSVPRVLLTTSCTHALEMCALLLEIRPGDEVVLPSFTFVSTANAFVLRGARPVFVDVRLDTLNFEETQLESVITPRTKAVVPVHYGGVGAELDVILDVAARRGVAVVEDNAHGLFAHYQGRYLGTFGRLATQSFHETKNISCGEGGALVINDPAFVKRAEILRDKGTNRKAFLRGEVEKYTWVDVGSSYVMSDILAAFLFGQLEVRERIHKGRSHAWDYYYSELREWATHCDVRLPWVPPHTEQSYHLFYILMPSYLDREHLMSHLRDRGILAVFHYQPLHLSPMGRQWGYRRGQFPITESIAERLLRLPLYNDISVEEQEKVVQAIKSWRGW